MSNFCYGCMQEKSGSPVCEHCGFDESVGNLPHQLPVGTVLRDQYVIGKVLGQGGFGITYLGWDRYLSIPIAIKEYYPTGVVHRHTQLGAQVTCATGEAPDVFESHKERFLKEARTLARLSSIPEIVQIKNFFSENGTAYIIMEYVEGITLKDHLKRLGRPMSEQEALSIMEPVLRALQQVHNEHLIHRDISPDNIMLPSRGGVKLIDFGTVRYTDASGVSKSTESVLKPGFAPMEQYNTTGHIGTWTDVYAICATFHYLLTGKVPADVMERFDSGESLTLLHSRRDLSPNLIQTLEQGMKVRANERIQTIGDLYHKLYHAQYVPSYTGGNTAWNTSGTVRNTPNTGTVRNTGSVHNTGAGQNVPNYPSGGQQDKKRTVLLVAIAAVCLVIAAVCFAWKPLIQPALDYKDAVSMMEEGHYEAAIEIFEDLGDYKDSRQKIEVCEEGILQNRYDDAVAMLNAGEYSKAIAEFTALGDYKNSPDMVIEATNASHYADAEQLLSDGNWREAALAFAALDGYKDAKLRSLGVWHTYAGKYSIYAGHAFSVGLRENGTVVFTGASDNGQGKVTGWSGVTSISAKNAQCFGLLPDGTVLATGLNDEGQLNVSNWTDLVAISAGSFHTVGLKSDGTVVATGYRDEGQCDISSWKDIGAISAGKFHTLGLRYDGTVVAVGYNDDGRCNVSKWTDIVAISAGSYHSVALRADGTVLAIGSNGSGQCNVNFWRDIVAISAGDKHTVGLKADGTVVACGIKDNNQCDVSSWRDIVAISAGGYHTLGLKADGTVVAVGGNKYSQSSTSSWSDIKLPE